MSELKSSDYKAGWRLRCEGVAFGKPWAIEGEYDGKYVRSLTLLDLRWALGEKKYPPSDDDRVTNIVVLHRPFRVEVGTWWREGEDGKPLVVTRLEHDDCYVRLRYWDQGPSEANDEGAGVDWIGGHWTPLPGPPEPGEGTVVVLRQHGNLTPLVATRINDVWLGLGWIGATSWTSLLQCGDPATLRILGSVEAAE